MNTIERSETFLFAPRWLFARPTASDGLAGCGEASLQAHAEAVASDVGAPARLLPPAETRVIDGAELPIEGERRSCP